MNSGVAYVLVYDAHNAIIAHTFVPRVPPALIEQHRRVGTQSQQVREIRYADPATGTERQIMDVGVPMLAGRLGMVHVGMDQAIIAAAATRAGNSLLLVFASIAALAAAAAVLFARRVTKPLTHLMDAATRVGRGDLSALVPITSRDEIGLLGATFNDTIVRLRFAGADGGRARPTSQVDHVHGAGLPDLHSDAGSAVAEGPGDAHPCGRP